ncbi:efflux RND transporter periplasmic adaptor subunit [Edaphobacter paludis]|uniref:Efflux RND transporter periplasmic adaptor subunit n=1 Tax=Edaphobacter paludis TaxID=3035702 RepID=A0AAU7DA50_9BACT
MGADVQIGPEGAALDLPVISSPPATIGSRSHKRYKSWLVWATILGLAVAAVLLTSLWRAQHAARVGYTTVAVDRGPVTQSITTTGTVNPVLNIIVGSYVSGVIESLYCDFNTRVSKGQLCAKIDPRPYQTIVDQDRANVMTADAQLAKDQAGLAYAELTFSRQSALFGEGVTSQDSLDNARSARDALRAQVALDQATISQHQAELQSALVNLSYTDIRSPVSGTVVQRNVTIGQTVAASFQTPTLFLIATDLTSMQVDTNVSESDLAHLADHNDAVFTVESYPDRPFHGQVVQVRQAPQAVQNVVTYDVVVRVSNKDFELKPGMTATVRIVTDQRSNALRVPNQALRFVPSGTPRGKESTDQARRSGIVWVMKNSAPHPVSVQLGLEGDTFTEVTGGDLHESDAVILNEQVSSQSRPATGAPRL